MTNQLKTVWENLVLVGEAKISKDVEKYVRTEASGKNGWMKKSINLGVQITDNNRIYVNQEAGYWSDEAIEKTKNEIGKDERGKNKKKENFVYNGEMIDDKWVADNIPFADRFKQENIDKVPYNKRIRISLEPEMINTNDDSGNIVQKEKVDKDGNVVYLEKQFIFIGDAIDYVKNNLKDKQRIYIYTQTEINQYISSHDNQLKTKFNRRIQQIRIARPDEENQAFGKTTFYFEKDGFDKSSFKKENKYYIQGYNTYKNDEGITIPVSVQYVLDFSNTDVDWENEDIKARVNYLVDIFESCKKDKVYCTTWRYKLFEGNEEKELTKNDLSKDVQKRIKLGFLTLEEALKNARGHSNGNRIREMKLVMPIGEDDKTLMEDYEVEDLIPPEIDENKINKINEGKSEKKEEEKKLTENITNKFDAMFK